MNTSPTEPREGHTITCGTSPVTVRSRRSPAGARRFLLPMIALASAVVGGAVAVVPPQQANAQAVVTPYYSLDSTVTCDPIRNTIRVTVSAGAQSGYQGMTVQFRTYMAVGSSASWSTWSGSVRLWNSWQQILNVASAAPNNVHAKVYVQMRYWTGYGWSAANGTWATPYMISLNDLKTPYYSGFCYT